MENNKKDVAESKQSSQVYKNTASQYEEISEKKTSKLGYLMLLVMVVFIVVVGENIFSDLTDVPEYPSRPTSCYGVNIESVSSLRSVRCEDDKDMNNIDKEFDLHIKLNVVRDDLESIADINRSISTLENINYALDNEIDNLESDYGISLQEKIANEDGIINRGGVKSTLSSNRDKVTRNKRAIIEFEQERDGIISNIKPGLLVLNDGYDAAMSYYRMQVSFYKLKVFLLTLIFVVPFFFISLYYYLRLKRENSPYTIIATATTTAFSFLFAQVILVFLYDVLPTAWLGRIFDFLLEFSFLRYIIYYGSVILVIALFGGIVYYIQKKVFAPIKVAVRRLKDGKCPGCSFPVNHANNFCPDCGLQLKENCLHCKHLKIRYLSHCPHCGKH